MIPEPYASIEMLPFDDHGWFLEENKRNLARFIREISPKVVVELGSWLGSSARYIASLLPKDGKLYAVDTWVGSPSHNEEPFLKAKLPTLYQQFLSNIIHSNLTEIVIPIQMTTDEAAKFLDIEADLIYVDADHSEEGVYNDILNWYPKLSAKGIICGDDYCRDFKGVIRGVGRATKMLGKKLYTDKRFWWLD